jgi:lipopolysaccharide/colanic/teichoic acid biosynthesis glycosyltransferase
MGKNMKPFKMIKFRSMVLGADKSGVNSTSSYDNRITNVGKIIRKFKLDELSQLFNVFIGNMSLVGPRPQIIDHVLNEYSDKEKQLLDVKPGITDFSSIVFSDEGDILKDSIDPNNDYNNLIRPWKSKLGIFYIKNQSILLDFYLILLTIVAIVNKRLSLRFINKLLFKYKADSELVDVSKRDKKLLIVK